MRCPTTPRSIGQTLKLPSRLPPSFASPSARSRRLPPSFRASLVQPGPCKAILTCPPFPGAQVSRSAPRKGRFSPSKKGPKKHQNYAQQSPYLRCSAFLTSLSVITNRQIPLILPVKAYRDHLEGYRNAEYCCRNMAKTGEVKPDSRVPSGAPAGRHGLRCTVRHAWSRNTGEDRRGDEE